MPRLGATRSPSRAPRITAPRRSSSSSPPGVNARAWWSDLPTAVIGSSADNDIADGNFATTSKFRDLSGTGNPLLSIRSAAGLGFADGFPKVRRAEIDTTSLSRMVRTGPAGIGLFPSPAVGFALYLRTFFNCQFPDGWDTGGNGNHPYETNGPTGQCAMLWKFPNPAAGGLIDLNFTINGPNAYPSQRNYRLSGLIQTGHGYRVEWIVFRATAGVAVPLLAVYDAATNVAIANSSSFIETTSGATLQAEVNSSTALIDMTMGDGVDAQFQDFSIGNNGPSGTRAVSGFVHWGPLAVSLVGLVGPWDAVNH